jgi:hypothetical protein
VHDDCCGERAVKPLVAELRLRDAALRHEPIGTWAWRSGYGARLSSRTAPHVGCVDAVASTGARTGVRSTGRWGERASCQRAARRARQSRVGAGSIVIRCHSVRRRFLTRPMGTHGYSWVNHTAP